jgi:hypothetical protein
MLRRYSKLAAAMMSLPLVFLATAASAVVLWDQSNWNNVGEGSVNLSSNSCSQLNGNTKVHTANDVHFDSPVIITSVTVYETEGNVQTATQAYLWIAPKTGPVPTASSSDVNNAANLVTITNALQSNGTTNAVAVTASGLSISLPAGDYWVSLTPRHSLGFFPYTVHLVTSGAVVGDPTEAIVACTVNSTWYQPLAPTSYDYAIKINGDVPVPTLSKTWGGIKGIYR